MVWCIDGTHIPIIAPSKNKIDYVNSPSTVSMCRYTDLLFLIVKDITILYFTCLIPCTVKIICDAAHITNGCQVAWPLVVFFIDQQPPTKDTKWINTNHMNWFGFLYFLQTQKQLLDFNILIIHKIHLFTYNSPVSGCWFPNLPFQSGGPSI